MPVLIQMKTGNFPRLMVRNLSLKCAKEGKGCCINSLVAGASLELQVQLLVFFERKVHCSGTACTALFLLLSLLTSCSFKMKGLLVLRSSILENIVSDPDHLEKQF